MSLPPKSIETLNALTVKRALLCRELKAYCIKNSACHDFALASDYLRSYACSIFELLKKSYSSKINAYNSEYLIASEAVEIATSCWDSLDTILEGRFWRETVSKAIPDHLGRPIYSPQSMVRDLSITLSTSLGGIVETLSPVLVAHALTAPPIAATASTIAVEINGTDDEIARRKKLLSQYKIATGASHKKIYEAHNSGIYKPQFYQWISGELSANSKTAKNFEAFLKSKKRPVPRKSTP